MKYGTYHGVVLSIVTAFILTSYLTYLLSRMANYQEDVYKSLQMVNNYEEGLHTHKMKDFNFMPSFEARVMNSAAKQYPEIDIF